MAKKYKQKNASLEYCVFFCPTLQRNVKIDEGSVYCDAVEEYGMTFVTITFECRCGKEHETKK